MGTRRKVDAAKDLQEIPDSIQEGLPRLKIITGKLAALHAATNGGYKDEYGLAGYQEVVRLTLSPTLDELDEIIKDIEKEFNGIDGQEMNV